MNFFNGEKLCLKSRGPRIIVKTLSDYISRVEDLRNRSPADIHGTRLMFYRDVDLDEKAIMSHVLSSKTGIFVARLFRLDDQNVELFVAMRRKGLGNNNDTLEPLTSTYEDVTQLTLRLLN